MLSLENVNSLFGWNVGKYKKIKRRMRSFITIESLVFSFLINLRWPTNKSIRVIIFYFILVLMIMRDEPRNALTQNVQDVWFHYHVRLFRQSSMSVPKLIILTTKPKSCFTEKSKSTGVKNSSSFIVIFIVHIVKRHSRLSLLTDEEIMRNPTILATKYFSKWW